MKTQSPRPRRAGTLARPGVIRFRGASTSSASSSQLVFRPSRRLRATLPGMFLAISAMLAGAPDPAVADEHVPNGPVEQRLTIAESIVLAVSNNRDLASGRLGLLAQQLSVEDAEDGFRASPSVDVSVNRNSTAAALGRETVATLRASPKVTLRIPTGGQFSLSADNRVSDEDDASQFVTLELTQPLLKGAGVAVGTADLVTARRAERIGLLAFRAAVMEVVTRTVYAYRDLVKSMRGVEIAERSLERARDLVAVNRVLIETGRMAEQDIVQSEANVAERELGLTVAEDALNDAHLALVDILDIDSRTRIVPTEELRVEPAREDPDRGVELALRSRPDYRQALLKIENDRLALLVADNARKWDLNLTASTRLGHTGRSLSEAYDRFDDDYFVGLNLNIPLGVNESARDRAHHRARISVRQSEIGLAELRQAIDVDVRRAVRDVEVRFRRTELARQARALSEQKLEIERAKLAAGLSSNFRLVRFEDDLVASQTSEIDAIIAYLNALTALDRVLGRTLETWGIEIDQAAADGSAAR